MKMHLDLLNLTLQPQSWVMKVLVTDNTFSVIQIMSKSGWNRICHNLSMGYLFIYVVTICTIYKEILLWTRSTYQVKLVILLLPIQLHLLLRVFLFVLIVDQSTPPSRCQSRNWLLNQNCHFCLELANWITMMAEMAIDFG